MIEGVCVCQSEDMEAGTPLYLAKFWEGDIDFIKIRHVKYCPVCGKKLLDYDQPPTTCRDDSF